MKTKKELAAQKKREAEEAEEAERIINKMREAQKTKYSQQWTFTTPAQPIIDDFLDSALFAGITYEIV